MGINIHNLIKKEYEKRQQQAYNSLEQRRREVYSDIPEISDIENQIRMTGIKYNKMILLSGEKTDKLAAELLSKIESLEKQKNILLANRGYHPEYLQIKYICESCKDTGFIEGETGFEKCSCYKQLLINHLYNQSNLKLAETENFSTFNENFYSDAVDEDRYGIKKSPRDNILGIKERCLNFIKRFADPHEKNLFFCGPTGVGKTFMANCIAYELINMGRTVLYQTAPVLFDTISEYKMKAFREEGFEDCAYKNLFQVELLIIDDLGTETRTPARYAELLNILNIRQINNLSRPCKTIISTNLEAHNLRDYYTERVESRIIGNFALIKFVGEDIRNIKKIGFAH
jgi:DNA replication protein DnaC